ncbi:MAG: type IV pilus modification PilV family protein [bacterium]
MEVTLVGRARMQGFTIVEVLVAAAIFLLVVLPLARLYTSSLDVVKNSENYITANHLVAERIDTLKNLLSGEFYPGGAPMDFSGCAGYPFRVVAGTPPVPTLVLRIRTPNANRPGPAGPVAGEPRPICDTASPPSGAGSGFYGYLDGPPDANVNNFPQYHYDDSVYIQLDATTFNTTNELQAIDLLNAGLDQSQIALAIISAQLDPLDAYAIYNKQMLQLNPGARIDGVEEYGKIIDKTLLVTTNTGAPNPGSGTCSNSARVGPVRWYEFGYRRVICDFPTTANSLSQLVLDPLIGATSVPPFLPTPAGINEILDSTKTHAQFRRVTEVSNAFYIGDDRNGDGAFNAQDYPNWWHFFFQSPNLFDPTQYTYGRLARVSVYWKTGKQRRDPLNNNRLLDVEKRVQLVQFFPDPDNDPCDSGYGQDDPHYKLDPYFQNGGSGAGISPGIPITNPARAPGTLEHNQERYDLEYRGNATPARRNLTNPTHFLDPQCVIRP